jgi:hypothetical protein
MPYTYLKGKEYIGAKSVTKEYKITEPTVYNRVKNDKYQNWSKLHVEP